MVVTKNTKKKDTKILRKPRAKKLSQQDLLEIGFDMAIELLETAVSTGDDNQVQNQLQIARGMALYLMSSLIFNSALDSSNEGTVIFSPSRVQAGINDWSDEARLVIDTLQSDLESGNMKVIEPKR